MLVPVPELVLVQVQVLLEESPSQARRLELLVAVLEVVHRILLVQERRQIGLVVPPMVRRNLEVRHPGPLQMLVVLLLVLRRMPVVRRPVRQKPAVDRILVEPHQQGLRRKLVVG